MNLFTAEAFAGALALIGSVIVIAALLSGTIERRNVPQIAVFLLLGLTLGAYGFEVLNVTLESPVLRVTSTLSLALVLFTDALALNIAEVRRHLALAVRLLGPGTLLSALLIAVAAHLLLNVPFVLAIMLGAALASTDPVMLRGLLRRTDIPADARQGLHLESGLNDVVLLPVVVIAMSLAPSPSGTHETSLARVALQQFVLGPGAGILIGFIAVTLLDFVRRRGGVRRDYESIYSIGVAFAAFAAAEAAHGSGFLAAFAAGLTIAWLDVELCDCFLDYGGATAELLLLFTFVLFGAGLIWSGLNELSVAGLLFAVFALLIRVPVYYFSLKGANVTRPGKHLIAWFGARGLSSLLLILLPVFAGIEGSARLFALCSLVVLLSIVFHGGLTFFLSRFVKHQLADVSHTVHEQSAPLNKNLEPMSPSNDSSSYTLPSTSPLDPTTSSDVSFSEAIVKDSTLITLDELKAMYAAKVEYVLLDARTNRSRDTSHTQAADSLRLNPEQTRAMLPSLNRHRHRWLVAYCA